MGKPKKNGTQCEACEGRGFLWGGKLLTGLLQVVERCDTCARFDSDQAAARAIVVVVPDDYWTWGVIREPDTRRVLTVLIQRQETE